MAAGTYYIRTEEFGNNAQMRYILSLRMVTGAIGVGEVTLDPATHTATLRGEDLALTTSELAVLEVLLRNAGTVVSRETLSQEALGRKYSPLDRSVDVHVSNLRRKLETDTIRTVRGAGYLYALR